MEKKQKAAMLIDAENIPVSYVEQIFSYAETYGSLAVREIYGDALSLSNWEEAILRYLIHPNLSVRILKGKNSSDIALTIGAMDLLSRKDIDTVIIISSDCDFSFLAVRLRNAGLRVVGMGLKSANDFWRAACTEFIGMTDPRENAAGDKPEHGEVCDLADPVDTESAVDVGPDQETDTFDPFYRPSVDISRRMIVLNVIRSRIKANGGSIAFPKLCAVLNDVPAYAIDRKKSGCKRARQYLGTVFADDLRFEVIDNCEWVLLKQDESKPADEDVQNSVQSEAIGEETEGYTMPANDTDTPEEDDPQDVPVDPAVEQLIAAGIKRETAENVCEVMTISPNRLRAYNLLRKQYGNMLGGEYYRVAREVEDKKHVVHE